MMKDLLITQAELTAVVEAAGPPLVDEAAREQAWKGKPNDPKKRYKSPNVGLKAVCQYMATRMAAAGFDPDKPTRQFNALNGDVVIQQDD